MRLRIPVALSLCSCAIFVTSCVQGTDPIAEGTAASELEPMADDVSDHAFSFTLPAVPTPGLEVDALKVTICRVHVDDPHESSHVVGTINVVGRVDCTNAVPRIDMMLTLFCDGEAVARDKSSSRARAVLESNVATMLDHPSGMYQGVAVATVTFPPGSWPEREKFTGTSAQRYLLRER